MRIAMSILCLTSSTLAYAGACPNYDIDLNSVVGPAVATGDTCAAANDNTATCGGNAASPDVSFIWTAPRSGTYQFDAAGSSYDTVIHIRDMQSCAELVCNDDSIGLQSLVQLQVVAGRDYFVVMDGFSNGSCGTFTLNISVVGLVPIYDPTLEFENTFGFCPGPETFELHGATPNGRVLLLTGTPGAESAVTQGMCTGAMLPFTRPRVLAQTRADAAGDATFSGTTSAGQCGTTWLVALNLGTCETSNIQTP